MKTLTDILLAEKRENLKYFKKPYLYAANIKNEIRKILPDAKVFIFGSVPEGEATPQSDIDILVTSANMPKKQEERAKIRSKIYLKIGISSPFEIHFANHKQFLWYQRFAKLVEI